MTAKVSDTLSVICNFHLITSIVTLIVIAKFKTGFSRIVDQNDFILNSNNSLSILGFADIS